MKQILIYSYIIIFLSNIKFHSFQEIDNLPEVESDEMVLKMKKFLDVYAARIKKNQNRKNALKIIIPSKNNKNTAIYSENFSLKGFKDDIERFIDSVNKIVSN